MADGTKDLIGRYYRDVWERGDAQACEELLADDYVDHDPARGSGADKAGAMQVVSAFTAGMRDVSMDVQDVIAEGDRAAAHWRMEWTQAGDLMGMPADGKRVHLRGHDFYRIRDGRITDIWHCEDFAGLLGELGAMPPMG